jgi:hypothetical protein
MAIHACGHVATGLVNELFSREGDRGVQFRPMASSPKHPPGPAMTLGNMRRQGVHHLIVRRAFA